MKKIFTVFAVLVLALTAVLPAYAAEGKVTYDGEAKQFVFAPGGEHSLTDLFPNFKDVMPGDTLTQKITVKNDASKDVKVKIFMRSLGAHSESKAFLSQLDLLVRKSDDNTMGYMFDAAADETAQLTDWVYLGTLYSGGEVNLDVTLHVPVELDNEFRNTVGYLDWELKVQEYPVEPDDPQAPETGDSGVVIMCLILLVAARLMVAVLLIIRRRKKERAAQ